VNRVLLLIKGLARGGAEQLLASAAPHMDRTRHGFEIAYLLPERNEMVPELEAAGLRVTCLNGARGMGWTSRLRKLIRERRIDIVHAHSPYAAALARVALPRGIPFVYTEHNVWQRYHPATRAANVLTFPRNDHVFAVSEEVRRSIRYPFGLKFLHTPPVETLYHGPGILPSPNGAAAGEIRHQLGIPMDAPLVGTVANMKPFKGHKNLLRAATIVRGTLPSARFVVVGQGQLESDVRGMALDLDLADTVTFTGYRDDAPTIMSALDVFALPSEYEGLPIALLEAMSLGTASVATRVGGVPEVIDEGAGVLVPPHDPKALADAIVDLLVHPSRRKEIGEAGQRRASRFDIRAAASRMQVVYGELKR
jgi:glycosyltransferase involved in cell wall biosynthesis